MKRFFLGVAALVSAASMHAEDDLDSLLSVELQGIQVTSTRALKKTPVAYTDMSQEQLRELRTRCALSVVADAISDDDVGCG